MKGRGEMGWRIDGKTEVEDEGIDGVGEVKEEWI